MSKSFNTRTFVSIGLLCFSSIMLITSVLMFSKRHTVLISMTHTLLGAAFLVIALWHFKNNFAALKQYFKLTSRSGVNWGLLTSLFLSLSFLVLSLVSFKPFVAVYTWGNQLRAGSDNLETKEFAYRRVDQVLPSAQGVKLDIDLRTGPAFSWPQYAIWLETMEGDFIQLVYITRRIADERFPNKAKKMNSSVVFTTDLAASGALDDTAVFNFDDEPQTAGERNRPESLPVFLHKLSQYQSQNQIARKELVDGYAGATLNTSFLLSSKTKNLLNQPFKVRLEINQSFDFNTYYSSDRFPDDPIYSGNGFSAQPSVIYEATIDPKATQVYYPMQLVGHGHHSGRDGLVYPDLTNLTTALHIIDRVIVEVKNQPDKTHEQ